MFCYNIYVHEIFYLNRITELETKLLGLLSAFVDE
jgi:hypothetical protein